MCTLEKRGNIYILTLTGTDDHRLNPNLLDALNSSLRHLHTVPTSPSSVLITTAHGKFFSNGYDLAWATQQSSPSPATALPRFQLMSSKFRSVISNLISLPMPTIAAVTGHASAAGFIFALTHDFVLMRRDRGFLYMSEVDIGLVISEWFDSILKCKIGDFSVRREVVLMAAKLTAEMAVERRIVYSAHDSAEKTVEAAVVLAEELVSRGWDGHVYGKNRLVVLNEVMDKIGFDETVEGQNGDNTNKLSKL
ncbi:enoyl-CoA delta isomerase 1, peroxisomal-like [Mercurialis annua]|uniref:enoyl-CoA delta isomerase 1, peroxisomal-like n=1 Tax=Mercurialis annua TaxID=3986 RepID=UPI00215F6A28|nr:enoyl-CoA delta isomerase 1, peroxisomal-like [Mercurialis annua]